MTNADRVDREATASDALEQEGELALVDLLLGQGSMPAQAALRQRVADQPLLAIELAETVALLEQFRQLRVEPSSHLAGRLADVVQRAERRVGKRGTPWLMPVAIMAAAALLTFAVLLQWDPLARRSRGQRAGAMDGEAGSPAMAAMPSEPPATSIVREPAEVAWQSLVEAMRHRLDMEQAPRLSDALNSGLQAPSDALGRWLDPRNSLVLLRLDHELRASSELRRRAMRSQGGLPAVDTRVQELADQIAAELVAGLTTGADESDTAGLQTVALAVRALIAAGSASPARSDAVAAGSEWLVARLPEYSDANLVRALVPLVEVAAVHGTHAEIVTGHGARLVEEVLREEEVWGRRRPALLTARVDAATLAEAGRLLQLLPGLGVDAARCSIVRQLVLGRLRERRDGSSTGDDGPEVLVAMVYGCADLLPESERDEIELQLSRWKPVRLAPDFVTVQQLAWAIEPGRMGFTRLQRELRQLAILPAPPTLDGRAAFCLSLATNYAAFHNRHLLHVASGE